MNRIILEVKNSGLFRMVVCAKFLLYLANYTRYTLVIHHHSTRPLSTFYAHFSQNAWQQIR